MWPWTELLASLAERRFKRDSGVETWKPARPVRDTLVPSLLAVPVVTGGMLYEDYSVVAAAAAGATRGVRRDYAVQMIPAGRQRRGAVLDKGRYATTGQESG